MNKKQIMKLAAFALIFAMIFGLTCERKVKADNEALTYGATGAIIGGAAGGPRGMAIGGLSGLAVGGAVQASRDRERRYNQDAYLQDLERENKRLKSENARLKRENERLKKKHQKKSKQRDNSRYQQEIEESEI